MTSARSESPTALATQEEEASIDGLEPTTLLTGAGARLARLIGHHPAVSLVGAFAFGFALARVARKLGGR